jgi:hypothetical protein
MKVKVTGRVAGKTIRVTAIEAKELTLQRSAVSLADI